MPVVRVEHLDERDRGTARKVDFHERRRRVKADPLPVWRKKQADAILGITDGLGLGLVEQAAEKLGLGGPLGASQVDDGAAIARDGDIAGIYYVDRRHEVRQRTRWWKRQLPDESTGRDGAPHTNDEPRRDKRKPSTAALWCYARLVIALGDPLQIHEHVMRGLASLVAVSSQAGLHEVFERGRRKRSPPVLEVTHARRHLVEHRPERVYVRTLVRFLSFELLRRHVQKRSQDRAFRGQRVLRRRKLRRRAARSAHDRETEIQKLHPRLREQHVPRLQVPVHDAVTMRLRQRIRHLHPGAKRLFERVRPALQPLRKSLPLQVLHDEIVGLAIAAHVVKNADVRVVERRDRARLALEALPQLGTGRQVLGKHLHGHGALETGVPRFVDFSHPARGDGSDDLVGSELTTGLDRHECQ